MLTPEQQKWIDHLSDTELIRIFPFDPTTTEKFIRVRERIRAILGDEFPAEHHGATSFGISGQDEIDVYVPVPADRFDETVTKLTEVLGLPRSHYPMNRARFVIEEDGKHVDIFPINQDGKNWQATLVFESHLRTHPDDLDRYRELKESGDGLSVREYYRRKYEFVNEIVPPKCA
jgi:GrpB-like predicted nucleotidyltransferase (UPF0157 family)